MGFVEASFQCIAAAVRWGIPAPLGTGREISLQRNRYQRRLILTLSSAGGAISERLEGFYWTTMHPGGHNVYKKRKRGDVKKCLPCWSGVMVNSMDGVTFPDPVNVLACCWSPSATQNAKGGGGGILISGPGDATFGGEVRTAAGGMMGIDYYHNLIYKSESTLSPNIACWGPSMHLHRS